MRRMRWIIAPTWARWISSSIARLSILSNANQDQPNALAQFPGQQPASQLLNNSKGISATYTAILTPALINNFTFGYTRQGLAYSGTPGDSFQLFPLDELQNYAARGNGRILP